MGCDDSNDYLINKLKEIEEKQFHPRNPCDHRLGIEDYCFNTIPIMLTCGSCNDYIGSGVFLDPATNTYKCFQSPVFRIVNVNDKTKYAVFELLQPQTSAGKIPPSSCKQGVCQFFSAVSISKFIRTGICINVDTEKFSGIECLPPIWAEREIPVGIKDNPHVTNVETSEYIAVSDGSKKIYYNSDGIENFNVIPDPLTISYSNLFINAMLQPPSYYTLAEGKLTLNTSDAPADGAYLILQFIQINQ